MPIVNKRDLNVATRIDLSGWQVRGFLRNSKSLYTVPINIEKRGKPRKNFLGNWVWPKGETGYTEEGIEKPREEDEIVYAREAIYDNDGYVTYEADDAQPTVERCPYLENEEDVEWDFKNSRLTSGFMSKKFARLFFRVKACFVPMTLHEVLEDYPKEMGVIIGQDGNTTTYTFDPEVEPEYKIMSAFKQVWDRGKLSDNPWVWAIKLERLL